MVALVFETILEEFFDLMLQLEDVCLGEILQVRGTPATAIGVVVELTHVI